MSTTTAKEILSQTNADDTGVVLELHEEDQNKILQLEKLSPAEQPSEKVLQDLESHNEISRTKELALSSSLSPVESESSKPLIKIMEPTGNSHKLIVNHNLNFTKPNSITELSAQPAVKYSNEQGHVQEHIPSNELANQIAPLDWLKFNSPEQLISTRLLKLPEFSGSETDAIEPNLQDRKYSIRLLSGIGPGVKACTTFDTIPYQKNKPLRSLTASLIMDYKLTKHWSFSTGLEFVRLTELFEWADAYILDENGDYVARALPDNPGETLVGTSSEEYVFYLVEGTIKKYNNYDLLDIPLYLRYSNLGNKFTWSVFGGATINVLEKNSGYRLDAIGLPVALSAEDKYFSRYAFSGGLELEYHLNKNLGILMQASTTVKSHLGKSACGQVFVPRLQFGIRYIPE